MKDFEETILASSSPQARWGAWIPPGAPPESAKTCTRGMAHPPPLDLTVYLSEERGDPPPVWLGLQTGGGGCTLQWMGHPLPIVVSEE